MEFELINPSDPYTFLADDWETAALTVFLINTSYGAQSKDGSAEVPIFLFGGAADWYQDVFGRTPDDGLAVKWQEVAKSLDSFMYGHFEDRRRYETALAAITDPNKKEEFKAAWQGGRSSLNGIGTYAHKLAKRLELTF